MTRQYRYEARGHRVHDMLTGRVTGFIDRTTAVHAAAGFNWGGDDPDRYRWEPGR